MFNLFFLLLTYFGVLAAQCFAAYYATSRDLNILQQIALVAGIALACALVWYVMEVKFDWSLPSRYSGLGVPRPKHDAGVVFAMGLVWYVMFLIDRIRRRR